jgi:predicted Zn-dependent protease
VTGGGTAGDDVKARIERSEKLLAQMPGNHLARFALANALFDAGRVEDAEREYRRCLESQPDWMAVAISLGRCLVMRGARDEARQVLAAARDLAVRQGHSAPLEEIADLESRCG